jgi:hypothetical protein
MATRLYLAMNAVPDVSPAFNQGASPTHKAILDHTRTAEGFATSDKPTASGMYYAVLIVEDNP